MTHETGRRKLGKAPARTDARTYRLGPLLAAHVIVVPERCNWAKDATWPIWANDRIGCCTQVSVASAIRSWTGAAQSAVLLTEDQVLENYGDQSGYCPGLPATDRGAVELDVLNRWRRQGYVRPGQTRDYLTAFGTVTPHERDSVRRAIATLGGLYIGAQIPRYVMDGRALWDVAGPEDDRSIVGGHAVWLHGYDPDALYFNSWGQALRMSWDWFETYCDEAYGLLSRQNWLGVQGCSPFCEDIDQLIAEMRVL